MLSPQPICTSSDAFALATYTTRLPKAFRALCDKHVGLDGASDLRALASELERGDAVRRLQPVGHVPPRLDADRSEWEAALRPVVDAGRGWHDAPWYITEAYLYRVCLDVSRGADIFASLKSAELEADDTWRMVAQLTAARATCTTDTDAFRLLLRAATWGNRADLCYSEVAASASAGVAAAAAGTSGGAAHAELLVVDDTAVVEAALPAHGMRTVHVIVDNSGRELLCDLLLADFLIATGRASSVTLHVKGAPTFFSDVTEADVRDTIDALVRRGITGPATAVSSGALKCLPNLFWSGPRFFDAPLPIAACAHSVTIVKGDANFRRLLHDTCSPAFDVARFGDVISQLTSFPATTTVVALRTLKSSTMCGLADVDAVARLDAMDPAWRVNGRRGVIMARAGAGAPPPSTRLLVRTPGSKWEPLVGYVRAVRCGNAVSVSGTVGVEEDGSFASTAALQARRAIAIIVRALAQCGATPAHVVRTRMYVACDIVTEWEGVGREHGAVFQGVATSMVQVARLIDPRCLVEIEADAVVEE
jgi:enamine deaminase RidA (YjgF/YER057c/UK114 family)